uniref:Xylose isomerase-like TIM barrel domain-containing protein n=1 Tax=viral metagenome TaxID=1070528 RepID=A0A6C0BDQ5_9ZZZZ
MEPYPFTENEKCSKDRISLDDIPEHLKSYDMLNQFYPHVKSSNCAYMPGPDNFSWTDYYECLYVWCCELRIPYMVFIWSNEKYKVYTISNLNWKTLFPLPDKFRELLVTEYNVGFTVGIYRSLRDTLLSYPSLNNIQMFASQGTDLEKAHVSKVIPSFNYDNIPAIDVIRDKNLSVFFHGSLRMNIAKFDHSKYISDLLKYATAHSVKGVVFHVGTNKNIPVEEAKNMMLQNIVNGIRKAKFSPNQKGTALFLLETSAGETNEMFSDIYEFIQFCLYIKSIPDVSDFFSVCVDTCHVFQSGYSPYIYLREFLKYIPVSLVHFNDSRKILNGRVDEHAPPGEGLCPWIYLIKVAQLCKLNSIPMVFEC